MLREEVVEQLESLSWFQPHSRTIGAHRGFERISVKRKVYGINLKHGERQNVWNWTDVIVDVSAERDDWDEEKDRGDW